MFNLSRYFSILSFVMIVLAAGLLGYFYNWLSVAQLVSMAENRNVAMTQVFRNTLWPRYGGFLRSVDADDAATPRAIPEIEQLHAEVSALMIGTDVIKIKVYNRNGRTAFSNDPKQIGEDKSANSGFRAALDGRLASELTHRNTFDSFEGSMSDLDVISSYVPIRNASGEIEGIFELYQNVTPFIAYLRKTLWWIAAGIFGVFGLLYLSQFLIVRRAHSILHRQGNELEVANRELDTRVQARTHELAETNRHLEAEIAERRGAEARLDHLAFHDHLTGLPNRLLLLDRLQQALVSNARSGRTGALLLIDLDNFKNLNDTLGHDIGDMLLQQVTLRLEFCVREGDTVARLGGDEFVLMLLALSEQPIESAAQTEAIGEKILAALSQPYQLDKHTYRCTASIGVTMFSGNQQVGDELIKQSDIAMYQAKKAGRNALRFFDQQMQENISARVSLENELHNALELQQFHLYYQIQVDSSFHPLGAEALIRWIHPVRGLVSPLHFVPLAEDTGLILPIGLWVLKTACTQLKVWQQDASTRKLTLAVNVSPKQFRQPDFAAQVQAVVQHHGINPELLKLELTEGVMLEDITETITIMAALNEIGVQLSLDDFGTGYSSLQYLKQLPLDQLKIDQSFVRDISVDNNDKAIVSTIIAMTQMLGLNVIAEGVETEEQRQLLLEMGCTHFQGYLFSKPVPIVQFEALLKQNP